MQRYIQNEIPGPVMPGSRHMIAVMPAAGGNFADGIAASGEMHSFLSTPLAAFLTPETAENTRQAMQVG